MKRFKDNSTVTMIEQNGMYSIIHEYHNTIQCVISDNNRKLIEMILNCIYSHSEFHPINVLSIIDFDKYIYKYTYLYSEIYDNIYSIYIDIGDDNKIYIFDKELEYY